MDGHQLTAADCGWPPTDSCRLPTIAMHSFQFSTQTQTFVITEKFICTMTTLQMIALLGAGVQLITMIRMVQKDRPRNVTGLVTACVHHCVVGTVAFPITVALCVVLVPASWLIVIPFRAFRLFVWLDNVNLLSLTSCFCPSCRCGLVLWP